jgi:hypothetical protein
VKVDYLLIRSHGTNEVSLNWTGESADSRSYIFINGSLVISGFMAGTKERSAILPVPFHSTFLIEVHEFTDENEIPNTMEELPQVRPLIAWNSVDTAISYNIYHAVFDNDEIESLNEVIPHFAVDLPPSPELVITRDTQTGLLSFRINC